MKGEYEMRKLSRKQIETLVDYLYRYLETEDEHNEELSIVDKGIIKMAYRVIDNRRFNKLINRDAKISEDEKELNGAILHLAYLKTDKLSKSCNDDIDKLKREAKIAMYMAYTLDVRAGYLTYVKKVKGTKDDVKVEGDDQEC